jgi:hypothetical protein
LKLNNAVIWLLVITLPLPVMSAMFAYNQESYDFFLLDGGDFSQKIKWYVHYTSYHVENIIKTFIIFILIRQTFNKNEVKIVISFLILSIFRLLEYWLFHHHVPWLPIVGIVIAYGLYVYTRK